jgi:PAS domain S-box-containing protein
MAQVIAWQKTLAARLGGVTLVLLAVALLVVLGTFYMLASLQAEARWTALAAEGQEYHYQLLFLANQYFRVPADQRAPIRTSLEQLSDTAANGLRRLREGDSAHGIPPAADAEVRSTIEKREEIWKEIKPVVEQLLGKTKFQEAEDLLARLEILSGQLSEQIKEGIARQDAAERHRVAWFQALLAGSAVLLLACIGLLVWMVRGVSGRTRALAGTAERIAAGELDRTANVSGSDELAALCTAFNTMTGSLRTTLAKKIDEKTRNRAILDSTADGIVTLDEKGTIRSTNSAAERLFGYKGDGLVGRNVSVVVPALYQEDANYDDRDVRPGEAQAIGDESVVTGHHRDGTQCTLALRVSEMTYHGEKLFIATLRDITKARKIEEERSRVLAAVREAVAQLSSASAEILTSTQQQAAGAQEQAAAVTETVATVEEVTQTAEQAAQRAKGVGEAVQHTLEVGRVGRKTVEESITALENVREQVEATAETILALAEQAQAIGEITATVADIAEQTNLLALNAAIEASRAGEHGRGFAVVAGEVKALADQSKKATAQVRQILGEVQKATNAAVLSTEEVTKGVAAAGKVSGNAGETIRALAETLAEAAQAAAQITASAGQQATGMAQIHQAMRNIDQVSKQNLAAVRQAEQAAQDLNTLGTRLSGIVGN